MTDSEKLKKAYELLIQGRSITYVAREVKSTWATVKRWRTQMVKEGYNLPKLKNGRPKRMMKDILK